MTYLAKRIAALAEEMAKAHMTQGFLPGRSTVSVVRRMLALAELAEAVEQHLAAARSSNLMLLNALRACDTDAAAIISLMKTTVAAAPAEAGGTVIPFRQRPQPDTSHPTGPDAA